MKKVAVVFLTTDENLDAVCEFAQKVYMHSLFHKGDFMNFYVFNDSVNKNTIAPNNIYSKCPGLTLITLSDEYCADHGYKNSQYIPGRTHIKKPVVALDKCLCWFSDESLGLAAISYDFIWVFEDDCFMLYPECVFNLNTKHNMHDLVVQSNKAKSDMVMDWHWPDIQGKIDRPWFQSMICAFGASRAMLNAIKSYANANKTLLFSEAMFTTLAHHAGLKVFTAPELRTIVWQGEWGLDDVMQAPMNVFHPKKQIQQHQVIRDLVKHASKICYNPANKLPRFVREQLHNESGLSINP